MKWNMVIKTACRDRGRPRCFSFSFVALARHGLDRKAEHPRVRHGRTVKGKVRAAVVRHQALQRSLALRLRDRLELPRPMTPLIGHGAIPCASSVQSMWPQSISNVARGSLSIRSYFVPVSAPWNSRYSVPSRSSIPKFSGTT